jgi:hypothetical protein
MQFKSLRLHQVGHEIKLAHALATLIFFTHTEQVHERNNLKNRVPLFCLSNSFLWGNQSSPSLSHGAKFQPGAFRRQQQGPAYTAKNGYPFRSWRVRRQVAAPARRKGSGVGWGRGAASSPRPAVRSQTRPGQDTLASGYSRALAHARTHARNSTPVECNNSVKTAGAYADFRRSVLDPTQGRTARSSLWSSLLSKNFRFFSRHRLCFDIFESSKLLKFISCHGAKIL